MIQMNISIASVGGRKFLLIGDLTAIPIDRIMEFDLQFPNGGRNNSVKIVTDDPSDGFYFVGEDANNIREFLKSGGLD